MLIFQLPYIILILLAYFLYKWFKEFQDYKYSTYFQHTRTPYWIIKSDKGKFGEYLTYSRLKNYELNGGKFLFNVYIPKGSNETTEIDLLLISSNGIFVFESKNYSGWIFGDEKARNWTQTLPMGRGRSTKEYFYNPIMQNRTHIKYLREIIGYNVPLNSIIVFSERCTLKNVKVYSGDVRVVNRYNIESAVSSFDGSVCGKQLSDIEINNLYYKLKPYTQVGQKEIKQHNENIRKKYKI